MFTFAVPRVYVKSSPSALALVVHQLAECINEQVNLGDSKLGLHHGLDQERRQWTSNAGRNTHQSDDRHVLWLIQSQS